MIDFIEGFVCEEEFQLFFLVIKRRHCFVHFLVNFVF